MSHPGPARRNPWPIRIAVGCGGLMLVSFLLVVGLVLWAFLPQRTDRGVCKSEVLGSSCTEVPPAMIARVMKMELPVGSTVTASKYVDWQDDYLEATVEVPAAGVQAWESSLSAWPPGTRCDATATCEPMCPPGATCVEVEDQQTARSYERIDNPDGSIRLTLKWNER